MKMISIHAAKTRLSRLVDRVAKGEVIVIAKAGKPLVKVVPLETPDASHAKRLGFLSGEIRVPDDFDTMGASPIERLFHGVA